MLNTFGLMFGCHWAICDVIARPIRCPPLTCSAGLSNWKHGWSVMKKNFCCQHHHVGSALVEDLGCEVGCLHSYHPGYHAPHQARSGSCPCLEHLFLWSPGQNHYQIVHHVHHAPPAHHVVSVPVPTPAPVPPAQHMVYHTHVVHVPHSCSVLKQVAWTCFARKHHL